MQRGFAHILVRNLLFIYSSASHIKNLDYSSRDTHRFNFPTIIKRWCQPFGFHARNLMNSFGCNFLSSSTGFNPCSCFFRLTLAFYFRFWLLWAGHSTFFIVSCPLSDLRCFRFLSSASVLDSDYSALPAYTTTHFLKSQAVFYSLTMRSIILNID